MLATCLVVPLVLAPVRAAEAQSASVPDPAAAALFQAGRDLLDRGNWKEGCAKFEASMILYPAASTLLNMARCYEHEGKLALAWSAYQRALVLNRETQGEERKRALDDVARKGLAKIEPRLPRIKIALSGGAPPGLRVTHNGKDVPVAMLGTVIPVDPGPQSISADAPGYEPFTQTVEVAEGKVIDVAIALRTDEEAAGGRRIPIWAWAAGGAGVALLAGAAAFRIDQAYVEGKQSGICGGDVTKHCPSQAAYDPADDNTRKNRDNALFIGLGVGGVAALSAAVVGFVTAPKTGVPRTAKLTTWPWVGPDGAGAGIGGRF
ncbi:hypothetical protein [Polyangium sp. y55x31]|uniref:hypothetical protein n=1 Tax=Polyangium sp. y55x31 TaxID=3042688 RepID=UPI002482C60E|nr:hypothetical protein [Polyangium sp. y55x31]MDI1481751.1 hypothetical protein [Polyangium sp. y55x31]